MVRSRVILGGAGISHCYSGGSGGVFGLGSFRLFITRYTCGSSGASEASDTYCEIIFIFYFVINFFMRKRMHRFVVCLIDRFDEAMYYLRDNRKG